MIIVNGTIAPKVKSGGGLDGNGNPIIQQDVWGAPIPCHISANKLNNLGKQNGNSFSVASYEILIELQAFDAGSVRLTENGRELGEFSVMYSEQLGAVSLIKIVV